MEHLIHDHRLLDLVERLNFTQAIYYTWTGKFPTQEVESLLNACLVALIDHGPDTLSAQAARVAASGGAETHAALAAGLLAAGKHHGSIPLQQATLLFRKTVASKEKPADVVAQALANGDRLPGFGHRVYSIDPRTQVLFAKAEKLHLLDAHAKVALELEAELEKQKGKKLCLNVDGAIAALLPAMGIGAEVAPGIFLVARSVGLMMQINQEQGEKPASQRKK